MIQELVEVEFMSCYNIIIRPALPSVDLRYSFNRKSLKNEYASGLFSVF